MRERSFSERLVGRKIENFVIGLGCFLPRPTIKFSPKWGENWGEKTPAPKWMKMPVCIGTWVSSTSVAFPPFCFIFYFFYFVELLYLPFFFSVHLQIHNFFAKKLCYFFVLFNEDIIINLYQLYFSSSLFSS